MIYESTFDVLEGEDREEQERRATTRASLAVAERSKERLANFVARDPHGRFLAAADVITKLADEAVAEYGGDVETAIRAGYTALSAGHAAGCDCGFCKNKGNLPGTESEDEEEDSDVVESSVKTACTCEGCDCGDDCDGYCKTSVRLARWEVIADGATVETGDSYQQERVSLPSSETGVGAPSPKIDKGSAGDVAGSSQSAIDVGSKRNQLEKQDVADEAEYNASDFDPSSPVRERQDADKSVGPPDTDRTKTWTGTEGQADPVTASLWTVAEE